MKLASFEAIVRAINEAGVRYLVAGGRDQDKIDIEHLRMRMEDDAKR